MTSPLDSYTTSMDRLRFPDETKARMTEGLRAAAVAKGAEKNAQPKVPAEVLTMPARRTRRPSAPPCAVVPFFPLSTPLFLC